MPKDSAPASCKLALWQVIEWLCVNARFFQSLCPMGLHFKLSLADKEKKLSSRSSIYWKDYIGVPWVWPNFLLCLLPCVLPPSSHSVFFWPLKFSTCSMASFPSGPLHMLSLPREHLLSLLYTRLSLTSLTDLHLHITLPTELSQMPRPGESGSAKVPMATCASPE